MESRKPRRIIWSFFTARPWAFLLFLLAAALFVFTGAGAGTFEARWGMKIAPAAVAKGPVVRLCEIAEPVGEMDASLWEKLGQKALWPAPAREGERRVLSRDRLKGLLVRHLGEAARLCILSGQLVIQRGGGLVTEEGLRAQVVDFLTPKIAGLKGEAGLREFYLPRYVFLERPENRMELTLAGELKPGRVSLHIREVDLAGRVLRKYAGSAFLDLWTAVPCAARPLSRKESLGPDKITYGRRNAAYLRGDVWDGRSLGLRVIRPVGEGQVLYESNLEYVPLVSKGDKVNLVFQGKYVRLMVPVLALADGAVGESIPVRNMQSQRRVTARVRDARTVVVEK